MFPMAVSWLSFDVLNLFPDFLQLRLGSHNQMGQRGIVRLGADGVEFPEDFLAKEIQRPARGSGGTTQGAELVKNGKRDG